MPNYKGHIRGGIVAFVLVVLFALPHHHPSAITMLEWLLFAIAGSLFPDVDIKSKGQKYFYRIMLVLFGILALNHQYKQLAAISILALLPVLVNHRGIFHRIWFVVLAPLITWYAVSTQFPTLCTPLLFDVIFFIAGAISHLWLDMGLRMIRL